MRLNETAPQISLSELLRKLSELGGSDLHITTGSPPQVRVDGHLRPLEAYRVLTSADTKQLAYSVLTDAQKHRFEENLDSTSRSASKGFQGFAPIFSTSVALWVQSFAPSLMRLRPSKISVCRRSSNNSAKNRAV